MQPTARLLAAAMMRPTAAARVTRGAVHPSMIIPAIVVAGTVYGVARYVHSQLAMESDVMNRRFAQQNTPRVMESRRRTLLVDSEGDPRRTIYNVLNW